MPTKSLLMQKELFRNDSFLPRRKRVGCVSKFILFEENARFFLLALLLVLYLAAGAVIFTFIEQNHELLEKEKYRQLHQQVLTALCGHFNITTNHQVRVNNCEKQLEELLEVRGNLSAAGLLYPRPKWDFPGAFYYVGTVISTIGFGMTIPRTTLGRTVTMVYGLFGCASCILFFNLFLERIVTLIAHFLRLLHTALYSPPIPTQPSPPPSSRSWDDISDASYTRTTPWRPSVYQVWVCLLVLCVSWMAVGAGVYSVVEGWSYFEALYFCFVSFATIGFGDYVSSQQPLPPPHTLLYRIANFFFLAIGCCSIYSLFNVMSMVIRHLLNWMIKHMDLECNRPTCCRKKRKRYLGLGLRPPPTSQTEETSSLDESDPPAFRPDRLVSLKEFLEQNKASLMMIQRQLVMHQYSADSGCKKDSVSSFKKEPTEISANSVGPLAILTKKFGEDDFAI